MENQTTKPIISPADLVSQLPLPKTSREVVHRNRKEIRNILDGKDDRLLLIVGPCSIHDENSAVEYARRLNELRLQTKDRLHIIMRLYFEKPRTVLGWKGLVMDPHLNGTNDIEQGLRTARSLLIRITSLGLGAGMEMLDPIIMEYVSDLVSWASVGARTSESQIHRQSASSARIPVGFKNGTDGSVESAVHAIKAAQTSHCFPGIDQNGKVCLVRTEGNPCGHLVLRGGKDGPNYDKESCYRAGDKLKSAGLNPSCIIDCSHKNSGKEYLRQIDVWKNAAARRRNGEEHIRGLMAESFLRDGKQALNSVKNLQYGVSVTDPCLGWEKTEELILWTCDLYGKQGGSQS
ncbi:MAG: 3-deoxy-7-phosphoheptulonate synthase [Chitinispirillaceae bacterium]